MKRETEENYGRGGERGRADGGREEDTLIIIPKKEKRKGGLHRCDTVDYGRLFTADKNKRRGERILMR